MRGRRPAPDPEEGPDWGFGLVVILGLVLVWMAYCTPLGRLPGAQSVEEHWREHG